MAEANGKVIGVGTDGEPIELVGDSSVRDFLLPSLASVVPVDVQIEATGSDVVFLFEAARKIRRRGEATCEGDLGERGFLRAHARALSHQGDGALQSHPFDEFIQRLTDEPAEYTVKMKRRKSGRARDDLKPKWLIQMLHDVIDATIHSG